MFEEMYPVETAILTQSRHSWSISRPRDAQSQCSSELKRCDPSTTWRSMLALSSTQNLQWTGIMVHTETAVDRNHGSYRNPQWTGTKAHTRTRSEKEPWSIQEPAVDRNHGPYRNPQRTQIVVNTQNLPWTRAMVYTV